MAIDVRMPKLSDNMEEGVIIRWMKAPGDAVAKGEALAEVETDKADVELEAAESGVLREIKVGEGQSAAVGAVIATLAAPGDANAAPGDANEAPAKASGASRGKAAAPRADADEDDQQDEEDKQDDEGKQSAAPQERPAPRPTASSAKKSAPARAAADEPPARPTRPSAGDDGASRQKAASDRTPGEAVRASPLAWRLADEAGVNLADVRGSGPGGRILKRDVEASVRAPARTAPERGRAAETEEADVDDDGQGNGRSDESAPERAEARAARPAGGNRVVEASRMRLAIAKRMSEAKREIPHFYVGAEIDMTETMRLRESIKRAEAIAGLTVTHLLLRALAVALVRHPRINASWRDGSIELHDDVNIGIAVAIEDGLVVPVLHRAQTLTLAQIAERAGALTEKARSGKFSGEELTGGTFSLSNVGMIDVDELVAVINPPQAAILAVASVKDRPIVRDGQLAVAKTMRATLSCDHRVLNGVEGGRFLAELKSILENPVTLLLDSGPPPAKPR
jgi:pyruvate dehydrogenase E2 component (dihydrolipoamide acetyltransferase)